MNLQPVNNNRDDIRLNRLGKKREKSGSVSKQEVNESGMGLSEVSGIWGELSGGESLDESEVARGKDLVADENYPDLESRRKLALKLLTPMELSEEYL